MNAFQSALFVFVIQSMQITFIFSMILGEGFSIIVPTTVVTMGSRFIATILMHLTVEGDIRQGLFMMKYASNHPFEFLSPTSAFLVGFMQFTGGLAAELVCILYLGKFDEPFLILIQFIALASIAKVDDIYFASLSENLKITRPSQRLEVIVRKRDWENLNGTISPEFAPEQYQKKIERTKKSRGCGRGLARFVFKTLRVFYVSWNFYFMPYSALFVPYMAEISRLK